MQLCLQSGTSEVSDEEILFVSIKDGNSDTSGRSRPSKQVNADEHVEFTEAETPLSPVSQDYLFVNAQISDLIPSFLRNPVRSSAIFLVSAVMSTRSPLSDSFIYLADYIINLTSIGLTSIIGSSSPSV